MIAEMPRGFSTSRILLYGWVSTANRIFADSEFMPFLVKNAMFDLQFYVDNTRSKGNFELLGGLETERLPVSHQHNVLRVYMEEQKLELRLDATETIAEFGSALLASNATQVLLVDGIATATVGSPFGELRIDNVPLSVPLEVRGIALSGGMSQSEMMTVSSFSLRDYKAGVVGPPRLLLEASLSIDAPLNVSLTFGPIALRLLAGESFLGAAVIPDLVLRSRSRSEVRLVGILSPVDVDVFGQLASLVLATPNATGGGPAAVTAEAVTLSSATLRNEFQLRVHNDAAEAASTSLSACLERPPWFQEVLRSVRVEIPVAAGGSLAGVVLPPGENPVEGGLLRGVQLERLMIDLTAGDAVRLEGRMGVDYFWPGAIDIWHEISALDARMHLFNAASRGAPLASFRLVADRISAATPGPPGVESVRLEFDPVPLELNESGPAFNEVTSAVLGGSDGGPLTLEIEGTASVSILMALGEMRLAGLEVNMDVHVEPLGELFLKRLHVDTLSPFAGNSSGLYFQHDVQIRLSPEESEGLLFGARLGPLSLQLMMPVDDPTEYIEALFQSQTDGAWFVRIGVLEMEGLVIDPAAVRGGHAVEIRVGIVIDPPKVDSGGRLLAVGPRQLISNFAGGRSTQVVAMSGSRPASSHPLVERALRTWRAEVTVPGASEKFLVDTLLDISGGIFLGVSLRVSLVVKNPLELPVSLFFIDFKIIASSNGEAIAAEKIDWLESPEVIPPGETVTTREFSVEVAVGAAVGSIVQAMWGRSGARLDFRAVGLLMLSIGEYRMVMDIDQSITQA
eukprot:Polyplicarium_translucidae@DN3167_c0_g2_i3.p1